MSNNISGQFMFVDRAELNAIFEEAAARIVATQVKKLGTRNKSGFFLRAFKEGAYKVMYKYEDVLAVLENK